MPADEAPASRLLHDDIQDVLAVKPPAMPEKFLVAVIVVFRPILEFPGEAAIGGAGNLGFEGPAGEGARRLADVLLGVVAGTEAEQLEELASPVLVDRCPVVLVVVEPEHHR